MDIPKVSRGGFFGIFIPGAFLLLNMSIVLPFSDTPIKTGEGSATIDSIEFGIMSFILAFALGIVLRVIPPKYAEVFHRDKFPYFRWYFEKKANFRVMQFIKFYKAFVISEYPTEGLDESNWVEFISKRDEEIGKPWINYFKTYVYNRSEALRQEILYQEGLARFVCGMCYALIPSIIVLVIGWVGVRNNWLVVGLNLCVSVPLWLILSFLRVRQKKRLRLRAPLASLAEQEEVSRRHDRDPAEFAQLQQVCVTGYDGIGPGFCCAFQNSIVVRVRFDGSDTFGWVEYVTDRLQFVDNRDGLFRRKSELGSLQDIPQFIENGKRKSAVNLGGHDPVQDVTGGTAKDDR